MGTLRVPQVVPSPSQDCERLRKAFQGWGTDENAVIQVLGHRNASQRRKIRDTYQELYNESLLDSLESELSGDFGRAVIFWTLDPPERDAKLAKEALEKRGHIDNLRVIIEIACASSPNHLMAVRQAYCSLFNCSLEEDIASHVNPPLSKLLVSLVSSYRYDREVVDEAIADAEAAQLHDAVKLKQLDHEQVMLILSTRNVFQLRATFECYRENYGIPIDQDIKSCGDGELEYILKVVVWCFEAPEKHFAEIVRASVVRLGTDEDSLTRCIVSRAEIDMMKIKEEYFKVNKTSLDDAVIGDTSGDYQNFLITLLGARP